MADFYKIKKDLKSWETEFFKENNRKPDKNDIQSASNDIKDLYSKYSKLKKLGNTTVNEGNDSKNENVQTEVWGCEFNRNSKSTSSVTKHEAVRSGFLDKMADKMFQNSKIFKPQKTKKNLLSMNSFSEKTKTESKLIDENESENYEEPFKDETNMKEGRTSHATVHDNDAELAIQSFGALKNKSFSNIRNFKHTEAKSLTIPETSRDIPKQFCLPSKPRFTVQSMEESKKKADHFEAELNNSKEGDNSMEVDCSFTDSSLPLNTHTENSSTPSFKVPSRNNEYVDTPRPNFVKRKSSLQEKLEKQLAVKEMSKGEQDNEKCYEYKSDSDTEPSPIKSNSKKRKASGGKTTTKKQKTSESTAISKTVSSDDLINSCVEEEEREANETNSQPVRRAAPVSKRGLNDNFVRLNMKAKKYKRKGGGMTGEKYKRSQWKSKMAAKSKTTGKCFICGLPGHWSNKCPEKGKGSKKNVKTENIPVNEEDFLSLKEAALLARGVKVVDRKEPLKLQDENDVKQTDVTEDEEYEIESEIVRGQVERPSAPLSFTAFYTSDVLKQTETPKEMKQALKQFGFQSFRPGQENAMKRILCGLSTLVVLSTGEGKSLCYQLPAYVYGEKSPCLTLVVSPLVSLMEDQVTGLPPGVKGACLHANMSKVQKENVFKSISEGNVHFLLVSPEAVVGGAWSTFGSFPGPDKLPPIAFVCIDEAHCLSEWSHNFRPSYLRLCKILREVYGVKCFLGLTATATKSTALDVAKHLGIEDDDDAIIRGSPVPKNLLLSVSRDEDKDEALINLLQGDRFSSCQSIIIYCTRREQANRVATYIRTCLQKPEDSQTSITPGNKVKKKSPVWSAECYHAGLTAAQRKRVQKNFMSGKLRVVVATVAFGMGLDKSDVRAVLHYNMPKSFESYVQEIGRAGRDRQLSHCHLFLDPEGKDLNELRRHTHGNTVDRFTLRKLLQKVFKKCRCREVHERFSQDEESKTDENNDDRICGGHERAISIEDCVMNLDIREEGIYTLLCYLELHSKRWVDILSPVYTTCQVKCYGGPSQLQQVSKKCPPLAVAIAKQKLDGEYFANSNAIEFPVVEISDSMGWESGPVKRELRQLQWSISRTTGGPVRSGVMVEFSNLGFHFRSAGDLTDNELDEILDFLFERVSRQESNELYQLDLLSEALRSVSFKSYWMCADDGDEDRSNKLKKYIEEFFDNEKPDEHVKQRNVEMPSESILSQFLTDVRQFYNLYGGEHTLTGRSISRIFHGIGSPCFPAETWGRVRRFWRSNLHVDFNICLKLASQELLKIR